MLVSASFALGLAMFDALSGFVVTSDAHEALFGCNHLGCISMWWYAYHACLCHLLAFYASLHACLYVHAQVLLASVSSMLQHNEAMDIRSKPTFVPRGHHILFAFLLVCLLLCLFAFSFVCSHPYFYACHVYHAYLLYSSFIHSLHIFLPLLICWFLIFAFACTHVEREHIVQRHGLPRARKKGEDASM